ncbi:hypothetical protein [Flavobacterium sp. TAB 87]|uniref:hypothetical protein n=1 Tax=Flavobacterium sp. TAB 87 TaxID=1729581 RepID=UPI00076D0EE2|nr:hypothetical protein [Flavobacterium sp. TAB 87]KVV16426.1 hypothetical protein AP058_00042 [Flavobacterium sp. TAB 87]
MREKISQYLTDIKESISTISLDHFEQNCIKFNSRELPDAHLNRAELNKTPLHQRLDELFLNDKESPFIYWFELKNENKKKVILDAIKTYSELAGNNVTVNSEKSDLKYYKTPAIKKIISDSNILYVGKVNRDFIGRLQPHLGFYVASTNTSGLQLRYWAKKLEIDIEIHYVKLPKILVGLTGQLERELAKELKPIIGKHRS